MGENLEQVLKEHDVTYHIVTKIKINVEGPSEKRSKVMASKVFGFDEKFVYTVGGEAGNSIFYVDNCICLLLFFFSF